jgi:hypothetical protein
MIKKRGFAPLRCPVNNGGLRGMGLAYSENWGGYYRLFLGQLDNRKPNRLALSCTDKGVKERRGNE